MSLPVGEDDPPDSGSIRRPARISRISVLSALFQYPTFRNLWLGTVFTQIGQWMLQITLGWVILDLTNSATWVGLIGSASGLPFLIAGIPAGVLVDRVDRRKVLLVCQVVALAISLILTAVLILYLIQPWHLLLAAFINGIALSVNNTARQTMVPSLVERKDMQNGIALLMAGMNSTRIIGPMLSGPIIALGGAPAALLVQSAFLIAALFQTVLLPIVHPVGSTGRLAGRALLDGIRFIRQSPTLSGLLLISIVPHLLVFPYVQLLPVFARDILDIGATGLGWLYAAGGTGAVVGALVIAGRREMRHQGMFILGATIAYGGLIISFAYSNWMLPSIALLFCASVLGSAFMTANNALFQANVSDELRGRVMAIFLLTWGLMPLGAMPMGYLGEQIGVSHAVALGAALTSILVLLIGLRLRVLREL